MESKSTSRVSFFERLSLAFHVLFDERLAREVVEAAKRPTSESHPKPPQPKPAAVLPPERVHASGLMLLSALQREGRLIDFLKQEIVSFSDEEVGAASRVVHGGCSKVLNQYFDFAPALKEEDGATVDVPAGFDAQRIRLIGNVAGQPPYKGTLRHHGWTAREVRLPAISEALDPRVVAPAEVELP